MAYESFGLAESLEQLCAIAEFGQITIAAQHLGIPQPTLSRAMARVSHDLGTPLLQKDGRGVRLTRHGELLASSARRALDELLSGVRAVRAERTRAAGPSSSGSCTASVRWWCPRFFAASGGTMRECPSDWSRIRPTASCNGFRVVGSIWSWRPRFRPISNGTFVRWPSSHWCC